MEQKRSKLEEIYNLIKLSKKTGIELTEEQLRLISEREEQYIKDEVLPVLGNSIEPILQKMPRDLTLVVNYRSNEPVTLRIFPFTNLSDLEDAVTHTLENMRGKKATKKTISPRRKLLVTMQDGTQFYEKTINGTFCKVIEHIGLMRVQELGIKSRAINVVSPSKANMCEQRRVGDFYILTEISTERKAEILKEISDRLNLDMKIEVIN